MPKLLLYATLMRNEHVLEYNNNYMVLININKFKNDTGVLQYKIQNPLT